MRRPFRLAWVTNLHLDRLDDTTATKVGEVHAAAHEADALVITGGISVATSLAQHLAEFAQGYGRRVFFVLGNHDIHYADFAAVHDVVRRLVAETPGLTWLRESAPIPLGNSTCLVGHDGFWDARWGDPSAAIDVPDESLIHDFHGMSRHRVLGEARARAEMEAAELRGSVARAFLDFHHVLVATHFAPWREVAPVPREEQPWTINRTMGEMLVDLAEAHPGKSLHVLTGHIAKMPPISVLIRPNLRCSAWAVAVGLPTVHTVLEIGCSSAAA